MDLRIGQSCGNLNIDRKTEREIATFLDGKCSLSNYECWTGSTKYYSNEGMDHLDQPNFRNDLFFFAGGISSEKRISLFKNSQ